MCLGEYGSVAARLLIGYALIQVTMQYCYQMKMLDYRTTETPDYRFHMTLHSNQTLSSVTHVIKEVPVPMWRLILVQHVDKRALAGKPEPAKTLYNATYKVCEFMRLVKRIRFFNNLAHLLFTKDSGNMSLSCPLAVGTYVMQNIQVPPDTGIMKFMYRPNTLFTLFGTVYAQRADKTLVKKCSYEINGTVTKLC